MKKTRKKAEGIDAVIFFKQLEAAAARQKTQIDIKIQRGKSNRQMLDIGIVADQIKATRTADTEEQTLIQSAIAVGYANAMRNHGLINSTELEDILKMITQAAEDNRTILQNISRTNVKRTFRKKVATYV